MKINRLHLFCLLLAALLFLPLLSCCTKRGNDADAITSSRQFTTERVGVQTGTLYEEGLLELCPNVDIAYYSQPTDMLLALKQGKLDSFLIEDVAYQIEKKFFPWLECLDDAVLLTPVGAAISSQSNRPAL